MFERLIFNIKSLLKQARLKYAFNSKYEKKGDLDQAYKDNLFEIEKNASVSEKDKIFIKYADLVNQLGFILFFSYSFPLAPLFAILYNIWKVKSDIRILGDSIKRPQAKLSIGIGVWSKAIEVLFNSY